MPLDSINFGDYDKEPEIICLCGSVRFEEYFKEKYNELSLQGKIVLLPVFCGPIDEDTHKQLDELHKKKIDMSEAIFVINPGGYVGEGTIKEVNYARVQGKQIFALEVF